MSIHEGSNYQSGLQSARGMMNQGALNAPRHPTALERYRERMRNPELEIEALNRQILDEENVVAEHRRKAEQAEERILECRRAIVALGGEDPRGA